ncbi:MAG: YqhR family membrane protein [Bacillus sp. (in: firmicutes)]
MKQQQNDSGQEQKYDQNKQEKPLSQKANVALIGFIGGAFWSALGCLAHYFNFTEVGPTVILSGWAPDRWAHGFLGTVIAILLYGLVSILVAFLYYAILRKVLSIFAGILFGIAIWAVVHLAFVPLFPGLKGITEMDLDSFVTTICLYILYGVFIGFSISFDANERARQKEMEQQEPNVQP